MQNILTRLQMSPRITAYTTTVKSSVFETITLIILYFYFFAGEIDRQEVNLSGNETVEY